MCIAYYNLIDYFVMNLFNFNRYGCINWEQSKLPTLAFIMRRMICLVWILGLLKARNIYLFHQTVKLRGSSSTLMLLDQSRGL